MYMSINMTFCPVKMPYAGWMLMDCVGNSISTYTYPGEHLCLQHSNRILTSTWSLYGIKGLLSFYFICMCDIKQINKIMLMTNSFVCIIQARQYWINSRFIWVHCSTMCNMSLNIWKNVCMWFVWYNCK